MSLLNDVRNDVASQQASTSAPARAERKTSDFWLNVGVNIPGGGKDGEDIFVSLPVGLALDDMKPQTIKGQNEDWIHLAQTKNALLAAIQKKAAGLAPGERVELEGITVEAYRKADPAQVGDAGSNPLLAMLTKTLGG